MGDPQTSLLPPEPVDDVPPLSAADALVRLDLMAGTMEIWAGKKSEQAQLMAAWRRWLLQIRPHVAAAAERSDA